MKATIVLLAAVQGFLIAMGLLVKKVPNRPPLIYLGLLVLVLSLEMLFSWGGATGYNNRPDTLPYWVFRSYLIIPAALWMFLRHHQHAELKFKPLHLWYFVPALADMFICTVAYLSEGRFLSPGTSPVWLALTDWLPLLLTILVLILHTKRVIARLAIGENQTSPHTLTIATVLMVFWLLAIIWFAEAILRFNLHATFQFLTAVMLFVLAYAAYFKPAFFESPLATLSRRSTEFANFDDTTELMRLVNLFEKEEIFKRPRLSLAQVAGELRLPAKYVSLLVKRYRNCNFNDFVNGYRVAEVIRQIPLEPHKTLAGIAMDAGFSSRSTFQQVFKHLTGKLPSEFLPDTSRIVISDSLRRSASI
ncbi:hypothetical protein C7T94_04600 [Pedobacter yulinensis]|uniref:HTH araC/xylS-type domain-containing protein n=1 Tax=Pedobacter yulinensis TaxID=2126353 RepID=A0A2T3HNJ6_9SPHI|nr:helix-turn-helix domain-containing protein [Pedobacter yulinensis]PST84022.1 hypothetical protein C7T94_04600 [Pedobacter yulinensis]